MEEEINYATVIFKNAASREKKEDQTIYSTVKTKSPAAIVTQKEEDPASDSEVKPKNAASAVPDGEAAARSRSRVLAVWLGILCVLLVVSISAIIYITVLMNKLKANFSNVTAENQELITERSILKRESEELSRVTDNLNRTLGIIMEFNNFPVDKYCPNKTECLPCQTDWILFQEKCYLFYNERSPWKTWHQSQLYCQNSAADLVVIDSPQEKEFVSKHIEYYYDSHHGYWIGLYETDDNNWLWIDGRNVTLSHWISNVSPVHCALMISRRINLTPANCGMFNKFICESKIVEWSN